MACIIFLSTPSARRATEKATNGAQQMAFLSTPSARRATYEQKPTIATFTEFLSTPSARRATVAIRSDNGILRNFYPRPPRGGRPAQNDTMTAAVEDFYPRPPRGGRLCLYARGREVTNFYPRPPRGGRRFSRCTPPNGRYFYPRPPRGGRHLEDFEITADEFDFYPRPPRGGRLHSGYYHQKNLLAFLSTPSARRATSPAGCHRPPAKHFYPRPPRGGRRTGAGKVEAGAIISIHALREEGDAAVSSGRSAGRISIHALREEGDLMIPPTCAVSTIFLSTPSARRATYFVEYWRGDDEYFYPRPPRGGRPAAPPKSGSVSVFLSTPSARRATAERNTGCDQVHISIHALREEGDCMASFCCRV